MTDLLVVIVNWQRPADTIECVQSLKDAGIYNEEVLLVDNGSQDASVEKILSAHPGIQVEALPRNLGFAGGYNAGIAFALKHTVEHIFLLNNDTTVDPGAIKALLESEMDVAIPKILFYDQPDRIWAAGAYWRQFPPAVIMNGYMRQDGPTFDHPKPLSYATGCAILANRKVFEQLGGFDQ
jgi:GT2 family glycosyltransferase